jgi:chemotaxis protein CheD
MAYFTDPRRVKGGRSTTRYAAPAIVALQQLLGELGSRPRDLEAQVVGGSTDPTAGPARSRLCQDNVQVAFELLERQGLRVVGQDVLGERGRKIVFNTATGETVVAKVDRIRLQDWYPRPSSGEPSGDREP